jgi:hypothetical protein
MTTETTAYLAYGVVLQEGDIDYPDEFGNAVVASNALSLECFGNSSECTRILCIKSSVIKTQWHPQRVALGLDALIAAQDWNGLLLRFCGKHNRKMEATPSWLLFFTRL